MWGGRTLGHGWVHVRPVAQATRGADRGLRLDRRTAGRAEDLTGTLGATAHRSDEVHRLELRIGPHQVEDALDEPRNGGNERPEEQQLD